MNETLLVFVPQSNDRLSTSATRIVGVATRLAESAGLKVKALLLGNELRETIDSLNFAGIASILLGEDPLLNGYSCETYGQAIAQAVKSEAPAILAFGDDDTGMELAARAALAAGSIPIFGCTGILPDDGSGKRRFTVKTQARDVTATVIVDAASPVVVVFALGAKARVVAPVSAHPAVERVRLDLGASERDVKIIEDDFGPVPAPGLDRADVVVTAGRGVGGKDGLAAAEELAEILGGEIAATRGAVSDGWIEADRMVGISGAAIRPALNIVCGASGAMQHVQAMEDSDTVIAININETAPIFNTADIAVIGDCKRVMPLLARALRDAGI